MDDDTNDKAIANKKKKNVTSFAAGPDSRRQAGGRMSLPPEFKTMTRDEIIPAILKLALDDTITSDSDKKIRWSAQMWCAERVFGKAAQGVELQGTAADALAAFASAITAKSLPTNDGVEDDDEDEDDVIDMNDDE